MKKKIISTAIAVIAVAGGIFTAKLSQADLKREEMSDLLMANVEALSALEPMQDCQAYCKIRYGYVCYLTMNAGYTVYCDNMAAWNYWG